MAHKHTSRSVESSPMRTQKSSDSAGVYAQNSQSTMKFRPKSLFDGGHEWFRPLILERGSENVPALQSSPMWPMRWGKELYESRKEKLMQELSHTLEFAMMSQIEAEAGREAEREIMLRRVTKDQRIQLEQRFTDERVRASKKLMELAAKQDRVLRLRSIQLDLDQPINRDLGFDFGTQTESQVLTVSPTRSEASSDHLGGKYTASPSQPFNQPLPRTSGRSLEEEEILLRFAAKSANRSLSVTGYYPTKTLASPFSQPLVKTKRHHLHHQEGMPTRPWSVEPPVTSWLLDTPLSSNASYLQPSSSPQRGVEPYLHAYDASSTPSPDHTTHTAGSMSPQNRRKSLGSTDIQGPGVPECAPPRALEHAHSRSNRSKPPALDTQMDALESPKHTRTHVEGALSGRLGTPNVTTPLSAMNNSRDLGSGAQTPKVGNGSRVGTPAGGRLGGRQQPLFVDVMSALGVTSSPRSPMSRSSWSIDSSRPNTGGESSRLAAPRCHTPGVLKKLHWDLAGRDVIQITKRLQNELVTDAVINNDEFSSAVEATTQRMLDTVALPTGTPMGVLGVDRPVTAHDLHALEKKAEKLTSPDTAQSKSGKQGLSPLHESNRHKYVHHAVHGRAVLDRRKSEKLKKAQFNLEQQRSVVSRKIDAVIFGGNRSDEQRDMDREELADAVLSFAKGDATNPSALFPGVIELLMSVLLEARSREVKRRTLNALTALCVHTSVQDTIVMPSEGVGEGGLLQSLKHFLLRHTEDPMLVRQCAELVALLVHSSEEGADACDKAGLLAALRELTDKSGKDDASLGQLAYSLQGPASSSLAGPLRPVPEDFFAVPEDLGDGCPAPDNLAARLGSWSAVRSANEDSPLASANRTPLSSLSKTPIDALKAESVAGSPGGSPRASSLAREPALGRDPSLMRMDSMGLASVASVVSNGGTHYKRRPSQVSIVVVPPERRQWKPNRLPVWERARTVEAPSKMDSTKLPVRHKE